MPKILIANPIGVQGLQLLEQVPQFQLLPAPHQPQELLQQIVTADALIVRGQTKVDDTLIAHAKQLKLIIRSGIGVDNIDLAAAKKYGVKVMNVPQGNVIPTAEHTLALLLAIVKKITLANEQMKQHQWHRLATTTHTLNNKTLAIIGLGRVGQAVAQRAQAWGIKVIAHDPLLEQSVFQRFAVIPADFATIAQQADFISLHVPLTPQTKHLINVTFLAALQRKPVLINTSRGEVIDETALLKALNKGLLAGVGLDVFSQEPPTDWQLIDHPLVLATPHIGSRTEEADEITGLACAVQVRDFFLFGKEENVVN